MPRTLSKAGLYVAIMRSLCSILGAFCMLGSGWIMAACCNRSTVHAHELKRIFDGDYVCNDKTRLFLRAHSFLKVLDFFHPGIVVSGRCGVFSEGTSIFVFECNPPVIGRNNDEIVLAIKRLKCRASEANEPIDIVARKCKALIMKKERRRTRVTVEYYTGKVNTMHFPRSGKKCQRIIDAVTDEPSDESIN